MVKGVIIIISLVLITAGVMGVYSDGIISDIINDDRGISNLITGSVVVENISEEMPPSERISNADSSDYGGNLITGRVIALENQNDQQNISIQPQLSATTGYLSASVTVVG